MLGDRVSFVKFLLSIVRGWGMGGGVEGSWGVEGDLHSWFYGG